MPPLLLMGGIWWLGGDRGSSTSSAGWLDLLLSLFGPLRPQFDEMQAGLINVTARKLGHVAAYGTLALLDYGALTCWLPPRTARAGWAAFGAALAWAVVDESRQSMYASRGGSPFDVILDAAGAALFLLLRIRRS